jgi:catechol 2,3-dioxygenase
LSCLTVHVLGDTPAMGYKLISQLAHAELFTPRPDETLAFYKDLLGLQESGREGQSVYLRAWGEFFHHSLKITEGPGPGLGHAAWRTDGPQELEDAARRLQDAGLEGRWVDGDLGHGRAYQFWMPGGHLFELVWEVERYVAPLELRSTYPNRPQRQVAHNAAVRRIDHVTVNSLKLTEDLRVFQDQLGFRFMEGTLGEGDVLVFATLTSGAQNHDYAIVAERPDDPAAKPGRVNHVCWYYDTQGEVLRALDILGEHGFKLNMGPSKHGIGELFFCYVYEPGGNMVELQTGGYWNYIPDWEPIYWKDGGIEGANTAWHVSQYGGFGQSPAPEAAGRQYTARERETRSVGSLGRA